MKAPSATLAGPNRSVCSQKTLPDALMLKRGRFEAQSAPKNKKLNKKPYNEFSRILTKI